MSRNRLAALCRAAALLALLLAVLTGYAERAFFSPGQFADRATAALRDERVRDRVAAELTDQVLAAQPDLLAARPLIEQAAGQVVGGGAFGQLFRAAVRDVHAATFQRDVDTVTLAVADAGTVLAAAIEALHPALAAEVGEHARITLLRESIDDRGAGLARLAERFELLAPLLALLTVALVAAGIWLAPDRRHAVSRLAIGTALVGVVIVLGYALARSVVLHELSETDDRDAAAGIWDAFLSDLRAAGWVLAGAGAVIAAAASSLIPPVELEPALRRLARRASAEPARPVWRAVRAAVLIAVGVLVVARPAEFVELLVTLAGVGLIYAGVAALLRMVYRPHERAPAAPRRRFAVAVLAAVLVVGAVTAFFAGGGASVAAPVAVTGCNGHEELCDRPLDEVVLPATHNAMSAGPDWFSSQQDAPIAAQLADGVRGLLIDTHYADRLPNGRVRTEVAGNLVEKAGQDGVSDEAVAAALRIRERLGFRGEGERGMYLCHTLCELGATPLADALDDLHAFLVTHPGEVVVVINQDYVTPSDFVGAMERAGLADDVYTPPAGGDWATLGELIASGRRLVVLAENEAGAAPWYQLVYDRLTQETPFSFSRVAQLTAPDQLGPSCAANRGPDGAPLFLINHWITTDPRPLPSNADLVNARDALLRRARDCERLRGQLPNLLAVDFYRRGDLFGVVDELNGVG